MLRRPNAQPLLGELIDIADRQTGHAHAPWSDRRDSIVCSDGVAVKLIVAGDPCVIAVSSRLGMRGRAYGLGARMASMVGLFIVTIFCGDFIEQFAVVLGDL